MITSSALSNYKQFVIMGFLVLLVLLPASKNYMFFPFEEASPVLRHTDSHLCGARYSSDLARGWIMCLCCLILQPLKSPSVDHGAFKNCFFKLPAAFVLCFLLYLSIRQDLKIPVSSSSTCGM